MSYPTPTYDWSAEDQVEQLSMFRRTCECIFGGPLHTLSEEVRANYALVWLGPKCQSITTIKKEDKTPLDTLWSAISEHIIPKVNHRMIRDKRYTITREHDESMHEFIMRCTRHINLCKYTDSEGQLIDQIIVGVHDDYLRRTLMENDSLNLNKCKQMCMEHETLLSNRNNIRQIDNIDTIAHANTIERPRPRPCPNCGQLHDRCPALGSVCRVCCRYNHWAACCRRQTHAPPTSNDTPRMSRPDIRDEVFINLVNNYNTILTAKVDTGAQLNLLPYSLYKRLINPPRLYPPTYALYSYGNTPINAKGLTTLECTYRNIQYHLPFHVVDARGAIILGLPTCKDMSLIKLLCSVTSDKTPNTTYTNIHAVIKAHPTLFEGIGRFPGSLHIHIDKSIPPVIHAARKVPINIRDEVANELNKMVQEDVLCRITEPTDWVSSLTYVKKKSGQIRICLDPKDLNRAIQRPHHAAKTLDDVNHLLCWSTVFTKLDARSGY